MNSPVETAGNEETEESAPSLQNGEPAQLLSPLQTFWYSLANIGYGMFYALNNAALPLFLEQYTKDARILSLMSSSDSIEGVIVQPVVGASSDRLRARLGRRRPFMLFAVPLSAIFMLLTPVASGLPESVRLGGIIAAIVLFTILFNVAWSPYQAWMPDITPEAQRGRVTAVAALFGLLGQAALMLLSMPIPLKFALCAAVMLVTTLLTCAFLKEPKHPPVAEGSHNPFREMRETLRGMAVLRQAALMMAVIFLLGAGIGSVFPLLTIFVKKTTGCTDAQAQQMFLVLMIASATAILPAGKLTDRFGPKLVLMAGSGLIVLASLFALQAATLGQVAVILAVAGVGNAAQAASRYPLLTALVPAEEVGFYTGLQATAQSLTLPVIALVTGELVNRGGYRVIFAACAVCVFLSIVVLAALRMEAAKEEIRRRNREMGRSEAAEPC